MILPIRTDSPLRTTPYMNWILILANVAMFLVQIGKQGWETQFDLSLQPRDPHLHSFLTYAFLHANVMHIVGNMLFLYIFGNNVNDKMGNLGYLAFYLAGAIFAGVGFALTARGASPVVGASGAVAAVTGAYLVLFPRSTITVVYFFFFIGTLELPCMWFILFFFAKDLIGLGGDTNVAHNAHVSGTLFGFTISFILLAVHLLPRDQFDVMALVKQWNRRRQYRDAVSTGWNPYGAAPNERNPAKPSVPAPPDPQQQRMLDLRGAISNAVSAHELDKAAQLYAQLRTLDPAQVLSRQAQIDVANQFANQQRYREAAEAYELFLKAYPKFEQIEQVELMLGLIYARYLSQFDKAKEHLLLAVPRLHGDREIAMAKQELARIEPMIGASKKIGER